MDRVGRAPYFCVLTLATAIFAAAWIYYAARPQIAVVVILSAIPRLHDIGRSGWWAVGLFIAGAHVESLFSTGPEIFPGSNLIAIILAVLLAVALVVLGALPGQPGANKFGAPLR
jgi:uncharacterized membrane protein YhaH (DUF805 family)